MNQAQDRVEVRLYEGRRMVASATGRLEHRDAASAYDSLVFSRASTGDRELTEIRFAGSPAVISLLDGQGAARHRRPLTVEGSTTCRDARPTSGDRRTPRRRVHGSTGRWHVAR